MVARNVGGRSVDMVSELEVYAKLMNKSMVGMCEI